MEQELASAAPLPIDEKPALVSRYPPGCDLECCEFAAPSERFECLENVTALVDRLNVPRSADVVHLLFTLPVPEIR
eukprot:15484955-Alexandrium_andersonii.AAC.1